MRCGIGYDIHRLTEGRALILGGVKIDYALGLAGHSDADVLLHAVTDALLGAAGLGDIGEHFPDTDPAFKDADSAELTGQVVRRIRELGFTIENLDTIIVAEKPKLAGYKSQIRGSLARILETPPARVNVKAKTTEGLGPIGEGRGIAAWAAVTLDRK
ncbi:MAG: 2-C-methyl-D-erythritol 2,4-cyclodiphosphate synthase [Phycisphaerae bacterium]|nr:2-C-methyl-D-erythritol 2,4-cyclodiphosphate synthase [Phycisphaerae bacterium]